VAGWALVAAGLALRGTGSRVAGRLLAAAGCAWLAASLATPGARWPQLFTLGLAAAMIAPALVGWALLVEAGGRLRRAGHVVVVSLCAALAGLLGVLPTIAYDPAATGCAACPANLLEIFDAPGAVHALSKAGLGAGLIAIVTCVVLALVRLARARAARRRRAWPLVLPGCLYLVLVAGQLVHDWRDGLIGSDTLDQMLWTAQAGALMAMGAGVGMLRIAARRHRSALAQLVVELANTPQPGALRDALAELLNDPGLLLLYASADGWIDNDGHPGAPSAGAAATPLLIDGVPVALLCHRPGLLDDPRVTDEIQRTVRLGLEHERLQGQLRFQLEHLRRSRADVVAASESQRRLLERDLHDGAQQYLAAFTFAVGLARHRIAPKLDDGLHRAQRAAQLALDELREIAHGLYPVALAEAGLAGAVESLADRRPGLKPISVTAARFPPTVEEAAYFVIASLADHWSPQPITVTINRQTERLVIDLHVAAAPPDDLITIEDRLGALNGILAVHATRSGQTHVTAELPCA
jgi:signal transduction histidine kinase